MYSLNVSLPSEVTRLASDLSRELPSARARPRGEHTLVVKRLGTGDRAAFQRFAARTRETLADAPSFAVRITGIDTFDDPTTGSAPVVYFVVESPGLLELHDRLCATFDPVPKLEGDEYTPHVTIARGGSERAAERLTEREIEPIEWTVSELFFWDAEHRQPAGTMSLPA